MDLIQYRLTDKPRFFLLIGDKALEIVNPEVLQDGLDIISLRGISIKPNDTFPVPDNIEISIGHGKDESDAFIVLLSKKEEKEPTIEECEEMLCEAFKKYRDNEAQIETYRLNSEIERLKESNKELIEKLNIKISESMAEQKYWIERYDSLKKEYSRKGEIKK